MRCVKCGAEALSKSARFCATCGKTLPVDRSRTAPRDKASDAAGIGCALLILLGIPYLIMRQCSTPPPTAEQIRADAAKAEEDQRRGFHCLSGWDGSNASLVQQVKNQLREPDSFEHIETRITPEVNGKHNITMEYRARNGFGGMNVATAVGTVDHQTCEAILTSTGE